MGHTLAFSIAKAFEKERGISVGSEWTYRSFIEGRSSGRSHLDL